MVLQLPDTKTNPNNLPLILRFLFFCDQCHDFCETAERNKWSSGGDGNASSISLVFNILKTKFEEDIAWLGQFYPPPLSPEITVLLDKIKSITEAEAKDTSLLITKIDNILYEYLNIQAIGGTDVLLNEQQKRKSAVCSGSSKILFQLLNLLAPDSENRNQFNITVDADKSKMNLGSLLLYLCDQLSSDPNTEINFLNTIATKYDAASGSGTASYLEKIIKSLEIITEADANDPNGKIGKYHDRNLTTNPCDVTIKFGNVELIKFSYGIQTNDAVDQDMQNLILIIKNCINEIVTANITSPADMQFVNIVTKYFEKLGDPAIFPKGLSLTKLNQLKIKLVELAAQVPEPAGNPKDTFTRTTIYFPYDLNTKPLSISSIEKEREQRISIYFK